MNDQALWDNKYTSDDAAVAARYRELTNGSFRSSTLDELVPQLPAHARVLEIGCGTGQHSVALKMARPDTTCVAVDFAERSVEATRALARAANVSISVEVADVTALPFADASFDAVFGDHVIGHIRAYHDALQEIARVTRPGGLVALNWANRLRPDGWPLHRALSEKHHYFQQSFFPWAMRRALARAGFRTHAVYGRLIVLRRSLMLLLRRLKPQSTSSQSAHPSVEGAARREKKWLKTLERYTPAFARIEYGIIAQKQ